MNRRRNAGLGRGEVAAGDNQVPPKAPPAASEMLVNPSGLANGKVRKTLVEMAQAINLQAQAMIAQVEQQGVPSENPPARTMANRLRDFTRMNPPIYTGSKIVENLEEECRVAMMHASMGLSGLMVHVQQVEESRKRKHTKTGNMSRHADKNF
ncbi:hypothetical protein EJD97_000434 [Solanum chilense]|uniref:Uncharacterized protein n=1 Tax=Solanum chilense TaxID=4083 RepID=A0A6N2C4Q9_SOLCI|nr:hypothetical protein EJD97_000434 [Solanum chilense]